MGSNFLPIQWVKVKGKVKFTLDLTWTLDGGGWSMPRPGCFTSVKDPVPIVQEVGWVPRPARTGSENLAPTGIRYQQHFPLGRSGRFVMLPLTLAPRLKNEWSFTSTIPYEFKQ